MKVATGRFLEGRVDVEGEPLEEGATVTVLARLSDERFEGTAEQEAELLASVAEAEHGETRRARSAA